MDGTAIILTHGLLAKSAAKTAHGLIRGTRRYRIMAVIDTVYAGKDAGEVVDGINRQIPVVGTLDEALSLSGETINYCLVGIAPKGGKLPIELLTILEQSIRHHISIVSGLHDFISDIPEMQKLADQYQVTITDIRKPKQREELHFWTGKIFKVRALTMAVLGSDTCLGKRTTARFLTDACTEAGINAQMISTGQTGWMQDGRYGFVLDTTVNDFVAGELEHAIIRCDTESQPDLIVVEGQSGLRNPTGPCGSEYLLSGNIHHVILQHAPQRIWYGDNPRWGKIPSVQSEIELIKMYGAAVDALALNMQGCPGEEAARIRSGLEQELHIPVVLPLEEGVSRLVSVVRKLLDQHKFNGIEPAKS